MDITYRIGDSSSSTDANTGQADDDNNPYYVDILADSPSIASPTRTVLGSSNVGCSASCSTPYQALQEQSLRAATGLPPPVYARLNKDGTARQTGDTVNYQNFAQIIRSRATAEATFSLHLVDWNRYYPNLRIEI